MVQRLITSAQLPRKVSAEAAYKSLPSLCTPSTDFEGYALREHRLCTRCHDCRAKSTRYGSCRLRTGRNGPVLKSKTLDATEEYHAVEVGGEGGAGVEELAPDELALERYRRFRVPPPRHRLEYLV